MSAPYDYKVLIDDPAPETPCSCSDCSWKGPFSSLAEIQDTSLTPGDPSPAGRCPECDTLAYIVKPETPELTALLSEAESFISGFEDDEMQESIPHLLKRMRAAIAGQTLPPEPVPVIALLIDALTDCVTELEAEIENDPEPEDLSLIPAAIEKGNAAIQTALATYYPQGKS